MARIPSNGMSLAENMILKVSAFVDEYRETYRGRITIRRSDRKFQKFQRKNPDKTFADFYSRRIRKKLDRGVAHKTLGTMQYDPLHPNSAALVHDRNSFALRTPMILPYLRVAGLEPHHTLVDYGCGALRVGQHLICELDSRNYWGLDITDQFYSEGLAMLDPGVVQQKRPNCRVISAESLCEVAGAAPHFIISAAVLKHVPMNELDTYFDRISSLMCDRTRLVINFWHSRQKRRTAAKGWSYPAELIISMLQERCPGRTIANIRMDPEVAPSHRKPDHRVLLVSQLKD